jgi:hypothetical protein
MLNVNCINISGVILMSQRDIDRQTIGRRSAGDGQTMANDVHTMGLTDSTDLPVGRFAKTGTSPDSDDPKHFSPGEGLRHTYCGSWSMVYFSFGRTFFW